MTLTLPVRLMGAVRIKPLTADDVEFAVNLTSTANWGFTAQDFHRMMELEPDGCFVALLDDARAGLLTTILYEKLAWIGNVIVEARFRRRGVGVALMRHAIDYLKRAGAESIGLYSYADSAPFYRRLGFVEDERFLRYRGKGKQGEVAGVRAMGWQDLESVLRLDEACFGAPRGKLLRRLVADNRDSCYVAPGGDGEIRGYVVASPSAQAVEVGPWVSAEGCREEASNLLKAVMSQFEGLTLNLGVPKKSLEAREILAALGFEVSFEVMSMYLGGKRHRSPRGCLLGMESLERG